VRKVCRNLNKQSLKLRIYKTIDCILILLPPTITKLSVDERDVSLHERRLDGGDSRRRLMKTRRDLLVAWCFADCYTFIAYRSPSSHKTLFFLSDIIFPCAHSPPDTHSRITLSPFSTNTRLRFIRTQLIGIRMGRSDCAKLFRLEGILTGLVRAVIWIE
jgi:hypothetical protein